MQNIESPFIRNEFEKSEQERKQRNAERLTWLAWGMALGLLLAFALFTFGTR